MTKIAFEIGRKYGNGQSFYEVVEKNEGEIVLKTSDGQESCKLVVIDGVESCFPNGKVKPLKASSVMGKPRRTTAEESRKRRNRIQNAWGKANYDKLDIAIPKGMVGKIEVACKQEGVSKRQYVVSAIEERLERTEKDALINFALAQKKS